MRLSRPSSRTKHGLCLALRYSRFEINGTSDSNTLTLVISDAYKIFTVDKVIGAIIKQVSKIILITDLGD